MAEQDFKRKLTAILSADVKGYSQLMRDDEEATVRTITTYREVIGSVVRKHRGEVVDSPGDNILAEFASVVDAVRGAVEIQEELKARNAELSENRKMEFRIGINLGDVIHEEKRIYGDGVNVAARVESLADAGGICVSRSAYDQVKDKLTLGYEYLGEHSVKNIAEPVRVYKVLMEPDYAGKVIGEERVEPKRGQRVALAVMVALILIVGGMLVWRTTSPPVEVASKEKMASPLPEKLSIAVLPFTNMSGDPKQEYFSDGITEEIITQLARFPDVHVIARNSTFTYKGKPVKVQQVGQELGVRYVLEGSVLRSGDRVRITAQLVDAATGGHIWAERYDRKAEDIFALQDDISQHIAAALGSSTGALEIAERKRVMSSDPNNLSAFDTFLRATEYFQRYTKDDNLKARKLAIKATELKPDYAQAYGGVGWTHLIDYFFRWTESPEKSLDRAFEWAQKALAIDSTDYESYWLLARIYTRQKKYDKALASAQRALALNPNSALLLKSLGGNVFTYLGRAKEAAEMIEKAMRLDPRHSNLWYGDLGRAYYAAGQYEKAVKALKHIGKPKLHLRLYLAASYAQLSQTEEAHEEVAQILKIDPKISVDTWAEREPYKDPVDKERWIDGLRKAGLPESPPLQLPDKPSIAVLPFTNMSDDPKQEYFSDGITDDLITDLSKISGLFVIARNSTFTYKGKPVKVQQVARDLGVRYVLEGSVRKVTDQVRINAQLIDATTGGHLWADRYDGKLIDIFALQDKVTAKIVTALAIKLTAGEQELIAQRGTKNVEAYDAYLQGWEVLQLGTRKVLPEAVRLFNIAVGLDPDFSRAHAALARAYTSAIDRGVDRELGWTDTRSLRDKHLKMAMKDPNPYTYRAVAQARVYERKYEEALAAAERAVALSPNDTDSHYSIARVLIYIGRPAEGLEFLHKAMRHNPHYPAYYLWFVGLAQFSLDQYEKAVDTYERLLKRDPKQSVWIPAAAQAHLSRQQEAANVLTKYLHMRGNKGPGVPAENMLRYFVFKNPKDADRFVDGLLKAGLPRPWNPVYRRHYDEAITKAEQSISRNPNDAEAQFTMGETLIYTGRSSEAVRFIKKAMELNPKYPSYYLWYLGLAQFCLEQYEDALPSLEDYYKRKPQHPVHVVPKWLLAATYAQLDRKQEAQKVMSIMMEKWAYYKFYNVNKVLKDNYYAFRDQKYKDRLADALHKAGLK